MIIKTIFFDVDDTLHDHQKPFSNSLQKIFPANYETFSILDHQAIATIGTKTL